MAKAHDPSISKQIRNLLIVVGSAVVFAFLAMFFMISSSNFEGQYVVKNILLAPENIQALSFQDVGAGLKTKSRFVFARIDFSYRNLPHPQVFHQEVDMAAYLKLYALIENETSVRDLTQEQIDRFNQPGATLVIEVAQEGPGPKEGITFTEINFVEDMYRISLRGQDAKLWAYFKKPGILQTAIELLTSP